MSIANKDVETFLDNLIMLFRSANIHGIQLDTVHPLVIRTMSKMLVEKNIRMIGVYARNRTITDL